MKWSEEYKVHYYYTDYNNILKPGYIARYMQETAWKALRNLGPAPEYLKENNLAFILSKISFRYYENIYEDDVIKVETWANPPKTLIFPRNYRITKNGNTAAEAVSAWVLMDIKEKTILRPDIYEGIFTAYDGEELAFAVQKRIKMPDEMPGYSEYKVRCSDIDAYLHMNNAAYVDLVCDNLYSDADIISPGQKKQLVSLDLNYNSEARHAQVIEINSCAGGNEHYARAKIKGSEQNCFEAKIVIG